MSAPELGISLKNFHCKVERSAPDPLQAEFPHVTFYRLNTPEGRQNFYHSLLAAPDNLGLKEWSRLDDPGIVLQEAVDRGLLVANSQPFLKELVEIRHPGKYQNNRERLEKVIERLGFLDQGVIVERSYRRDHRFVQILPEAEFHQVINSRNLPVIPSDIQKLLEEKEIAIAGLSVGGIGAYLLAATGFVNFSFADRDDLALSNFRRIIGVDISRVGLKKARVLAMAMLDMDPYIKINAYEKFVGPENDDNHVSIKDLMKNAFILVEAIDQLGLKAFFHEAAVKSGVSCLMGSDLGTAAAISVDTPGNPIFGGRLSEAELNYLKSNPQLKPEEFLYFAAKMIGQENIPKEFMESVGKTPWMPQPGVAAWQSAVLIDVVALLTAMNRPVVSAAAVNPRRIISA